MGTLTCELNWVLHWYVNSEDTRNNEMCRNRHSSYPCCQREQDTHTLFSQNILIVPTEHIQFGANIQRITELRCEKVTVVRVSVSHSLPRQTNSESLSPS